MSQKAEMCGACRKLKGGEQDPPTTTTRRLKIGEQYEVLNYPPQLRGLALELPRSYREKALAHWAAQNIDLSDPSDWELEEIQSYLTAQAAIYQRKAGYVKAHSERRRIAAWEAKQSQIEESREEEALANIAASEGVDNTAELMPVGFEHAVAEVTKRVNKKLAM